MRSRILAALAVAVTAVAGFSAAAGTAAASAPAHRNANSAFCNYSGTGKCMYDHGNGNAITAEPLSGAYNEIAYQRQDTGKCGGVVSSSCPFPLGSGLNNKYNGDWIVIIPVGINGGCMAAPAGVVISSGGCTGNGTDWVWDPTYTFINIHETFSGPETFLWSYAGSVGLTNSWNTGVNQFAFHQQP